VLGFLTYLGINYLQKYFQLFISNYYGTLSLSFMKSLIIFGYNRMLPNLIKRFTSSNRHKSHSQNEYMFIMYLSITSFLNTAVTALVLTLLFSWKQDLSVENGESKFVNDMMFIYLYAVLYGPIYSMMDPSYFLYKWYPRRIAK